jgi:hypothetical protein
VRVDGREPNTYVDVVPALRSADDVVDEICVDLAGKRMIAQPEAERAGGDVVKQLRSRDPGEVVALDGKPLHHRVAEVWR